MGRRGIARLRHAEGGLEHVLDTARMLRCEVLRDGARQIGRTIVDHDDLELVAGSCVAKDARQRVAQERRAIACGYRYADQDETPRSFRPAVPASSWKAGA